MLDRALVSEQQWSSGLEAALPPFPTQCWFTNVWSTYSEKRFKEAFRISRSTFMFLLGRIRNAIEKDTITEERISPEARLAICLYRLARGDYHFTLAEMAGIGERTVGYIVNEVTTAIVECLWEIPLKNTCRNQKKNLEAKS